MYEFHPLQDKDQSKKCVYCQDEFTSKKDLMTHKKSDHPEKVQLCTNISEGGLLLMEMNVGLIMKSRGIQFATITATFVRKNL